MLDIVKSDDKFYSTIAIIYQIFKLDQKYLNKPRERLSSSYQNIVWVSIPSHGIKQKIMLLFTLMPE